MADRFTNMDALWLIGLAHEDNMDEAQKARLRLIAQHLQSMDERLAVLQGNTTYAAGYAAAQREIMGRSNIVSNPEGEDARGKEILALIDRRVAEGAVKKVPQGVRALDDQPAKFNAPVRKTPKPSISLDLTGLDEL